MRDEIKVKLEDFFESNIKPNTHVIFNPPYGEKNAININEFYQRIGDTSNIITRDVVFEAYIFRFREFKDDRIKPSKKIKVFNGKLECRFLRFDIYKGSKNNLNKKDFK